VADRDELERMLREAVAQAVAETVTRDMAGHVGGEVHAVLKRHGMMMETAVGAIGMGLLASIQVLRETLAFARKTMGEGPDADTMDNAAISLFFEMLADQSELASDWLACVRADEREACAKVADSHDMAWARKKQQEQARGARSVARDFETMSIAAVTIAAAIRERGQ